MKVKQIIWRVINLFPRFISEVQLYPPTLDEQNPSNYIIRKNITSDYDHFEFLNETFSLRETGWDNKITSKLWRYNLHYFECLNLNCFEMFAEIIDPKDCLPFNSFCFWMLFLIFDL